MIKSEMDLERDPTMNARIVHSVGVTNKKELSTLHHKQRSLKSAKNVQEHIHRSEEKELIRQLTKLQDEKCRRHPEMMNSRSNSRTNSRLSGTRADSKTKMILQVNQTTGQLPSDRKLSAGKSIHNAAIGSRSHLAGPPTQSGLQKGKSSHQTLMNRRQSSDTMRDGRGPVAGSTSGHYTSISDLTHGHLGVPGVGSRHTSIGVSPQTSYELNHGPPPVHQPAGYGHTIKEHVKREGLDKKRPHHSYMDPIKGGSVHRRASIAMEDHMKGSHMMLARPSDTGSRISLNTGMLSQHHGPRASSHMLAGGGLRSRESGQMLSLPPTSSHGMGIPSRFLVSRLFSGQAVLEEEQDKGHKKGKRRRSPHRTSSGHSIESSESEEVIRLECHDDLDHADEQSHAESDHKVHFKEKKEPGEQKEVAADTATRKEDRAGKSDHVVAARRPSVSKAQEERKKSTRKSSLGKEHPSHKPIPPNGKKAWSKSAHTVKLSSESRESKRDKSTDDHHDHDSRREHVRKARSKDASHSHIHIPIEILNDLRSAMKGEGGGNIDEFLAGNVGSSTTAYDPSSNSVQNRRFRARLRALQFVDSQMAAQRQHLDTDPSMKFDPLQVLKCRYLRLSQSNIDTLTEMCREAGIEVGVHPHMNIEDVGEYVFGSQNPKSRTSSSSSINVKKVLV